MEECKKMKVIKVGYLISYDYDFFFHSISEVYPLADQITLCIDERFQTWSGDYFKIPDSFFERVRIIDIDHKISFYRDRFFVTELSPIDMDTRQRNMLAKAMGQGGWHIQIDTDEYPLHFGAFTEFLKRHAYLLAYPESIPVNILGKWITLFKATDDGLFYIKPSNETVYLATNFPRYEYCKKTAAKNVILDTYVLHQSWARSEEEVRKKLDNWSHRLDFNTGQFFEFWKSIHVGNHSSFQNFHPITPDAWQGLEFQAGRSIREVITRFQAKCPRKNLSSDNPILLQYRLKMLLKKLYVSCCRMKRCPRSE